MPAITGLMIAKAGMAGLSAVKAFNTDSEATQKERARQIADWNQRLTKHYQNITDYKLRGVKKDLSDDKLTQDLAMGKSNIIAQKEALKKNTFRGLEANAIKTITSAPENIEGGSRTRGRSKAQELLRKRHQTAYAYTNFIKEKEPFLQQTLRRVAEDKRAGIKGIVGPLPRIGQPPNLAKDSSFEKFSRAVVAGVKGYAAADQGLGAGGSFEGFGKMLAGLGAAKTPGEGITIKEDLNETRLDPMGNLDPTWNRA